jgi:UDPglucose--hexose-1-phosphate uridylyltransferase
MQGKAKSIKRWNPLLGEWSLFAPNTGDRPWDGAVVSSDVETTSEFESACYLCPGVKRAGGETNPEYKNVFSFDNDFASLSMDDQNSTSAVGESDVSANGLCRVVCFSPQHNLTLAKMCLQQVAGVVSHLQIQFRELSAISEIENVMLFENKGEAIGVSNPHPHGQIYATDFIPRIPTAMYRNQADYLHKNGSCMLCDLLKQELIQDKRVVCSNRDFVAFVPPFARNKYEVYIVPRNHVTDIASLDDSAIASLSNLYHEMLIRYDNLFQISFPNITVFYNAPCKEGIDRTPWHFHIAFFPPLRSPDKLKYLAGFETGGGNIVNPSLPEDAAVELRNLSAIHYLNGKTSQGT